MIFTGSGGSADQAGSAKAAPPAAGSGRHFAWQPAEGRPPTLTLHGATPDSRIADLADPALPNWLICESHDDTRNAAAYHHVAGDTAGVRAELASDHTLELCLRGNSAPAGRK